MTDPSPSLVVHLDSLAAFKAVFGDQRACPIEVILAEDVEQWKLLGLTCDRCGNPLTTHEVARSGVAPPGSCYLIDRDAIKTDGPLA